MGNDKNIKDGENVLSGLNTFDSLFTKKEGKRVVPSGNIMNLSTYFSYNIYEYFHYI